MRPWRWAGAYPVAGARVPFLPSESSMTIRLRKVLSVATAGAVVVTAAVILMRPAEAAITSSQLVNPLSGKCLDVTGNSNANGTQVEIWTCKTSGADNQKWTSTSAGELRVTIGGVTKCLDAFNHQTANGTKIEIWSCNGGANQKWTLTSDSTIVGVQSGKCLDIFGNGTANGTVVQLWTCKTPGNNNQRWVPNGSSGGGPTADELLAKVTSCSQISNGKYKTDSDVSTATVAVCQKTGAVFWKADMDIDCDGIRTTKCNENTDDAYQPQTSFETSKGRPFQADKTHFFVIPLPSSRFDYRRAGIKPGSVAAVIFTSKVVYAVFADEGPKNIIGEASYATAKALGINPDPSNGGTDSGVTYIVFPGKVPSPVESNTAIDRTGAAAADAFVRG